MEQLTEEERKMLRSDEVRNMMVLHRFDTGAEVWLDANQIMLVERLPASKDSAGAINWPERTKVIFHSDRDYGTCSGSVCILVSERPSEIAEWARWQKQENEADAMLAEKAKRKNKENSE